MHVKLNLTNDNIDTEKPKVKILYVDITKYNPTTQFIICCAVVFLLFIIYGYMQELIFTLDGFKPYGWHLTLIQFGYYTVFGLIEKYFNHVTVRKIPIQTYILLALLTLGTMGLSNASLGYLNYPTQIIFKCCKLIPVLIGGILIQGKRFGFMDVTAALLMCIGLTLFVLADSAISPNFNLQGVIMISGALLCDAAIGNVQEKSIRNYGATNTEVVLYSYSIGFVYIFFVMMLTGDLMEGVKFCANHKLQTYGYAFIFSLSGYMGIQVVLTLVRTCGALAAATVTTCRKAVTIIISFIFFAKPFTFQYLWSGLLVVLGIYLNVLSKKHPVSFVTVVENVNHNVNKFLRRRQTRQNRLLANV